MSGKRRRYHEPCRCGDCPKLPSSRPPTKREAFAYVQHQYEGFWTEERVVMHSIELYVHSYRRWVNDRGWRKPPEWRTGRVALCDLRNGKAMFPEEAQRWMRELKAGYRSRQRESGA